jgi:hypothetical protein
MHSPNSSEMEDQLTMTFQDVMEEAMSMLQAKDVATVAASSSIQGPKHCRQYINRDCEVAHFKLWHNYFGDDCMYPWSYFHRRYRMQMTLFLSIIHKVGKTSPYFYEMYDAIGRAGLTVLQKCNTALRQLDYDMTADTIDEYLKL